MRFQLALNKTSCPTPPPLICRRLKHRQRIKNYKTLSVSPPHRFSKQISQYQYWKASKYSILMVIELGSPASESSNGSQNFIPNSPPPLTDSEHKFHETGIENWLPIGFNLTLITTTLCSTTNGESLQLLYTKNIRELSPLTPLYIHMHKVLE